MGWEGEGGGGRQGDGTDGTGSGNMGWYGAELYLVTYLPDLLS